MPGAELAQISPRRLYHSPVVSFAISQMSTPNHKVATDLGPPQPSSLQSTPSAGPASLPPQGDPLPCAVPLPPHHNSYPSCYCSWVHLPRCSGKQGPCAGYEQSVDNRLSCMGLIGVGKGSAWCTHEATDSGYSENGKRGAGAGTRVQPV